MKFRTFLESVKGITFDEFMHKKGAERTEISKEYKHGKFKRMELDDYIEEEYEVDDGFEYYEENDTGVSYDGYVDSVSEEGDSNTDG